MPIQADVHDNYIRLSVTADAPTATEVKLQNALDVLRSGAILLPQDAPAWAFSLLARQNAIITILEQLVGRGK
jgi:hypothetical protein